MPIDNCIHSYEKLSNEILPSYFLELTENMKTPKSAADFVGYKSATKEVLKKAERTVDFPGCYVFIDNLKPIYVGISRNIIKRLTQHLNHDSHFSASLVYKMATEDFPHEMKRDQAMRDEQFRDVFLHNQSRLQNMKVAYIQIQNDLELYLFEVYASMKLDTDTWNTFRTH